jgi:hypothetical protein
VFFMSFLSFVLWFCFLNLFFSVLHLALCSRCCSLFLFFVFVIVLFFVLCP